MPYKVLGLQLLIIFIIHYSADYVDVAQNILFAIKEKKPAN